MTPDTPEPQPPDGRGAPRSDGSEPRPPRVLVSVGDFEDPAEWDVIVVENENVDDDTARQIARQRSGRRRTLPSLDERDVQQAYDTDSDAEAPDELSDDAFAPPAGPTVRRRLDPPSLPPPGDDLFPGQAADPVDAAEGPSGGANPAEPTEPTAVEALAAPGTEPEGWSADDVVAMDSPTGPHRRVSEDDLTAELGDYPQADDEPEDVDDGKGVDETSLPVELAADPDLSGGEASISLGGPADEDDGPEATAEPEPVIEPAAVAGQPERTEAELLDNPGDDFYDIGADEVSVAATAEDDAEPVAPVAVEGERDLLDDPANDFYALDEGTEPPAFAGLAGVAAATGAAAATSPPDPGERLGADLWGTPSTDGPAADAPRVDLWADASAPAAPDDEATGEDERSDDEPIEDAPTDEEPTEIVAEDPEPEPEPEPYLEEDLGEDFEDEIEFDSTFPLGPGDLGLVEEAIPVELDSLDYANVFGPVQGTLSKPDLAPVDEPRPPRRPRPAYQDDLYLDEEEDDHEDMWAVTPARTRGRRRELLALGIAAGVMIAIGIGSQIYGQDDPKLQETADTTSTTTKRRESNTTTTGVLPLPTIDQGTLGTDGGAPVTTKPGKKTTNTTKKPPTTTKPTTPTTTPPTTPTTTPTTTPPTTPTTSPPSDGGADGGADTTGGPTDGTDGG